MFQLAVNAGSRPGPQPVQAMLDVFPVEIEDVELFVGGAGDLAVGVGSCFAASSDPFAADCSELVVALGAKESEAQKARSDSLS